MKKVWFFSGVFGLLAAVLYFASTANYAFPGDSMNTSEAALAATREEVSRCATAFSPRTLQATNAATRWKSATTEMTPQIGAMRFPPPNILAKTAISG